MKLCYIAYPNSLQLRSANAVQTHATVRELRRLAPDTLVIIPRMARGPSAFDSLGVTYLPRIGIGRLSRLYRSTLWYYAERSAFAWMAVFYLIWLRLVHGRHYDVIYVREVICAAWLALLAPRLCRARVIYEVHDLESRNPSRARESWAQPLLHLLDRAALTLPTALTSLTSAFRDLLAQLGLRERHAVAVLPDAFDPALYSPRDQATARQMLGLEESGPLVVYAGLTFAYRGLDMLMGSFAEALLRVPDLRLVLVGGRPQELAELQTQARTLGVADRVIFAGPQPQERVPLYLAAGDILAVPDTVTDVTASPLKLFEYMAMGRAVVCPDLPALHEITGGDGALHIPRRQQAALTDAIIRLADDADLRERLGMHAIKRVGTHTYARRATRLLAVAEIVARSEASLDIMDV